MNSHTEPLMDGLSIELSVEHDGDKANARLRVHGPDGAPRFEARIINCNQHTVKNVLQLIKDCAEIAQGDIRTAVDLVKATYDTNQAMLFVSCNETSTTVDSSLTTPDTQTVPVLVFENWLR